MSKRRLEIDAQVKKLLASCKSEEEKIHRYLRIAQQYLYIEEHCEAEKYLLRYIKAKPESHEAHKLVGELYLKLRRFQDAYDSLKSSYDLHESKEVLANICQAAPQASITLAAKKEWLKKAQVANVPQISMLSLREAVLREGDASVQEMEDVLKERAALHPLEPEAQIKLLVFYAEASRFEDCVKVILREEGKQEMRNSPHWYKECQNALTKLRSSKSMPYDQNLALLHLHISQRLTLGLITDPFFIADQDKGSVGLEPFFRQLEIFDNLLDEALTNKQWYREGLWSFALDHFTGQLLFLFALGMLRRADESNREDTYKARGQALMFCALEYKPRKLGESWFTKLDDDYKELVNQLNLDGCYRTTSCYYCLANTSTDPSLAESVKIAVSGSAAIKFVTERLFPGKAIAAAYTQTIIGRACTKLPERAVIAPYESKSCIAFAGSLEHIVWLLLSGAEMPTEKIFSSLPMVPNVIDGAHTPSQSDIDAFLSAVLAAVKAFGNKLDIIRPTIPREILHRVFTTSKQQNFWNAMYRTFVRKVTAGRDTILPKKIVHDGLELVRGRDAKKAMPVYYLVQIARDLREKGLKKTPYFSAAVNYFKIVLSRLDEQHNVQPALGGGRTATSSLFELPKTMAASEDAGGYRDEARLEIGKFLLYSGELEKARAILELVFTPKGYLYYARTAKELFEKFFVEGDVETGERLLEKAKSLLNKGLLMARGDPETSEKLKAELESLERTVSDSVTTLGTTLNISGICPRETTSCQEVDMAKFDSLLKEQTARILQDASQKSVKLETDLAEIKAMQTKLVETLAQVLAEQTVLASQAKAAVLTNSEMVIKFAQVSQQLTRVEEQLNTLSQTTTDYTDYQETSSTRTQQYQSGGLVIPPGAGLPQFNLTGVQHPSAQTAFATAATSRAPAALPVAKEDPAKSSYKILFESQGAVYEKTVTGTFAAISGVHPICVLGAPDGHNSLLYFNSQRVFLTHDLGRMTYLTYDTIEGQLNVQWTIDDKSYYIDFADWSIQPGEILMRVFQDCGVPFVAAPPPVEPSPSKENIFLAAALNKTPVKSPIIETSPRLGRGDETQKSSFFFSPVSPASTLPAAVTTAVTSSPGILPTPAVPVAPAATASSPFSFSFNKTSVFSGTNSSSSTVVTTAPVSSIGGFTFSTAPVTAPPKVLPAAEVKTEKPKTIVPNPFSNFSFGFTKPEDQKPALGAWPASTTSTTTISTKSLFSFSTPTTTAPTVASSPSGARDVAGNDGHGADGEGEDYECTAQFQPVIALPQLVETKTGEEGEEVKFCERAKLYRFDTETREWKERGLGEMKILRNEATGKYRVLMRREQVLKICANHQIVPGMRIEARSKPTEYTWAAPDFADGEQRNEQFVVRFKTKEQADKFKEVFEECLTNAQVKPPVKTKAVRPRVTFAVEETEPKPSLSEMFKPAAGSWDCEVCLVRNKPDSAACVSCSTPNPAGGAKAAASSSPVSSFKFGVPAAFKEEKSETSQPDIQKPGVTTTSVFKTSPFKFGLDPKVTSLFGAPPSSSEESQAPKPPISTTFTFGLPPAAPTAPPAATGFVFGQTVAPASTLPTTPQKASSATEKTSSEDQKTPMPELSAGFTFGSPQQHHFSFEARHSEDEEDQVVESQDRDFAPAVAQLPPEIDIVTGEEGQEVLYSQRAKLFRFVNKEWKERGLGEFKLLKDPKTKKVRLTMRREQVHKVCLNHYLSKEIIFNPRDDRSLEWQAVDFAEGEPQPTLFAIRVRNPDIAATMLRAIQEAQLDLNEGLTPERVKNQPAEEKENTPVRLPKPIPSNTTDACSAKAPEPEPSSPADSVEIIKEERACDADVRRARELMLPDHFFLYESRENRCKGCRGCEADEAVSEPAQVEADNEVSVKPKKVSQQESPQQPKGKVDPAPLAVVAPVKVEESKKTPPKVAPVFGAPAVFGTVAVEQTRKEPLKPLEASSTTTDSGFVFGTSSTMSFSALAATSAPTGFTKPSGENPWGGSQPTSFFSAFSKTGGSSSTTQSETSGQVEDSDEVEPSKDIHFEPVIPMPDLIKVQTGEEEDEVLYTQRAKLYVFHAQTSEWKERAIGDAKILRCADGRARIVIRRDTVHKVACNHYITEGMQLKPLSTATNSLTWSAVDFAGGDPTPQLFALKVKTEVRLKEFKRIFEEEVERAKKAKEEGDQEPSEDQAESAEDLEDFEIVKCSPEGIVTTKGESAEDEENEETPYKSDDAVDEEAGDEDSENCYDDDDLLFIASVKVTEEVPIGENQWIDLGQSILRMCYDDDVFGHVIHLSDAETDTAYAETIIAVQTSLRETGRKGIWMAMDTKQKPSRRRRFCAEFNSDEEIQTFSAIFSEGKDTALKTGIVENSDQAPWTSPKGPFSS